MHSIRDVLGEKGTKVLSIGPDETVYEAIRQMAEHGIGALLVVENGTPIGLLSERDYSRKVILRGLRSRETAVRAIMSSPLLTISPDASVQHGLEMMTEKYIRHIPVMDRSGVLGMVSIGDLVKAVIRDQESLIEQLESYIAR